MSYMPYDNVAGDLIQKKKPKVLISMMFLQGSLAASVCT